MSKVLFLRLASHQRRQVPLLALRLLGGLLGGGLLLHMLPALAHHPTGGQTPDNFFTGLLSGIGHPVIGLDHFVFVVAAGLLAALYRRRGLAIPVAFVLTALLGTGLHLMAWDLPAVEWVIALSVLGFGVLLAKKQAWHWQAVTGIGAIAGLFHGYAYGEAIIGAQMAPLVAYLAGFTLIQLVIALCAFAIAKRMIQRSPELPILALRLAGFAICGVGLTILSALILG